MYHPNLQVCVNLLRKKLSLIDSFLDTNALTNASLPQHPNKLPRNPTHMEAPQLLQSLLTAPQLPTGGVVKPKKLKLTWKMLVSKR